MESVLLDELQKLKDRIAYLENCMKCCTTEHRFEQYRRELCKDQPHANLVLYDYYYKCTRCGMEHVGLSGT